MRLQSLGYRSDLLFAEFDGVVEDRGHYLVVRTLTNPNYFWGNLLIFNHPPVSADFSRWTSLFRAEFTDPSIEHMTFAWDSPSGEIGEVSPFRERGFELETRTVLATSQVAKPRHFNSDLMVRPLASDWEWQRMIEIQIESAHQHLSQDQWEEFYRTQADRYRKMAEVGRGLWFGGFMGQDLVAGLGIFHADHLGRYQLVSTHPGYQRRGICGTLVYQSARYALNAWPIERLVICADPDSAAARIYESVGFAPVQLERGLCRWDKSHS